ncbi:MAG: hypothetical protein IKJ13_03645 [Clostridia bacterium]|nr:hypothetical protein [Clostridia bacterium]
MKTPKALKILTLLLTITVLVIGFCFAAFAAEETSELSVSIIKKNVSYSDCVKVLFAVDDTYAGDNEVELLYYLEDPSVNSNATAYKGEEYTLGYTDNNGTEDTADDVTYPAFYSAGFSAKHIDDRVYARAHIVGTEIYSDVVRYSVVEYLLERLYVDGVTGDRKDLCNDLLSYGASAQRVLINGDDDPDNNIADGEFITDYVLVGIENGTLDGRYDQGIYFVGDALTPYRDGALGWNVETYNLSAGTSTINPVANGAEIAVAGFTMITESEEKVSYKPDLTDTADRINWSDYNTVAEYKSANIIDHWTQTASGSVLEMVDGAPYGESSKVIHQKTVSNVSPDQLFIKTTKKALNPTTYIFETDIMVDPDASVLYDFIFRNGSAPSGGRDAYKISLGAGIDGKATISGTGFATVSAPGVCGQWFRLRLEYTDVSDTEAKVSVYYNDQKVAESSAFTKLHAAAEITDLYISASSTSVGDLYMDNTKAAEYKPPYLPDMSDLVSRETYEDGDALNMFSFDNWNGGSSDCTTGIVNGTPYGESSKVYEYVTVNGYTPEVGFKPTKVNGANIFFYETDMMLDISSGTYVIMEIRGNSSNDIGYNFYLKVSETTVVLLDSEQNTITSVCNVGEWFRIGAEYVESGDTKTVNLYINGKQVGSDYTGNLSVSLLEKIRFVTNKSDVGQIYFDNTKVEFVNEFIYNSESQVTLVYDSSTIPQTVVNKLADSLKQYVSGVTLSDGTASKADHEIIVGKVNSRPLSTEAYNKIGTSGEGNVGYCIYSDGTSVAIAFDEAFYGYDIARDAAIEDFLDNYVTSDTLKLEAGVVVDKEINAIEYQKGVDEIAAAESWAELEANLTEKYGSDSAVAIVEALKDLYTLYSGDMVNWFANLYDPEIGGFYYSMSARDNIGFLPDLESTNQTLGFIAVSGMIEGSIMDFIPEDMQNKIVAFARGLQDPTNGYFYHPQWTRADSDAHPERLGRDVSNAVRILRYFGKLPLYDAPDGTKGESSAASAAAKLTRRLSTSTVSAVSMVTYTSSEEGVPDYLLNDVNFSAYLAQYDETIKSEAYWVGNLLESMATQIVQRDKVLAERGETYSLAKIATDWLSSHQDPETGLWETYEGQEYDCVNGILKISSAYNKMGYPVPNALKLLDYAIDAITSTADPHHVCCVLNTWYAITVLTTNISTFSETAEEDIAKIRDECIPKYPEMIRATKAKYALFVKNEGSSKGGFSYFQNKTSNTSQGMRVALNNVNEADVNSTYICSSGTIGHIFGFLGAQSVDIFSPADGLSFLMTVDSLGPIVKNTEIPPEPIDFEDVTVDELYDNGDIDMYVPGGELVVENGFPYGESSKVMRFSTVSGKQDLFQLNMTKSQGTFNAVAFESDIMFDPDSSSDIDFLMFGSSSSVRHVQVLLKAVPNKGVYISHSDFGDIKIANCGSWFNLRVEYAKLNSTTLQVDIYVNDVLKATCKTPYSGGEALDASTLTRIQFMAHTEAACDACFDNMFLEQFTKNLSAVSD